MKQIFIQAKLKKENGGKLPSKEDQKLSKWLESGIELMDLSLVSWHQQK